MERILIVVAIGARIIAVGAIWNF